MTQATTLQTLIQGTLPGNTNHKNFRSAKHQIPQELQTGFINSLIPRTITHSNWSNCLRYQLWTNTSSLHTPLNPALILPTLPLISNPPFDKSNIICRMVAFPNLKPTYTLLSLDILWPSITCSTRSPFTLQTSGIPNHMVWPINIGYNEPCALILAPGALHESNHVSTLDQSTVSPFH